MTVIRKALERVTEVTVKSYRKRSDRVWKGLIGRG